MSDGEERAPFLRVTEIFHSLQGESTWAGLPCTFVRLTGCPLRCVWCDTEYSFHGGEKMTLDAILGEAEGMNPAASATRPPPPPGWAAAGGAAMEGPAPADVLPLVEITGGEPLIHRNTFSLAERFLDAGWTVLVETSGAVDIAPMDPRVHVIMDL